MGGQFEQFNVAQILPKGAEVARHSSTKSDCRGDCGLKLEPGFRSRFGLLCPGMMSRALQLTEFLCPGCNVEPAVGASMATDLAAAQIQYAC